MRFPFGAYALGLGVLVVLWGVWGSVFRDKIEDKIDRLEELMLSNGMASTTQSTQLEHRVTQLEHPPPGLLHHTPAENGGKPSERRGGRPPGRGR